MGKGGKGGKGGQEEVSYCRIDCALNDDVFALLSCRRRPRPVAVKGAIRKLEERSRAQKEARKVPK